MPCVFPFKFGGKQYNGCIEDSHEGQAWCSTQVDHEGNHITGQWGHCHKQWTTVCMAGTCKNKGCGAECGGGVSAGTCDRYGFCIPGCPKWDVCPKGGGIKYERHENVVI